MVRATRSAHAWLNRVQAELAHWAPLLNALDTLVAGSVLECEVGLGGDSSEGATLLPQRRDAALAALKLMAKIMEHCTGRHSCRIGPLLSLKELLALDDLPVVLEALRTILAFMNRRIYDIRRAQDQDLMGRVADLMAAWLAGRAGALSASASYEEDRRCGRPICAVCIEYCPAGTTAATAERISIPTNELALLTDADARRQWAHQHSVPIDARFLLSCHVRRAHACRTAAGWLVYFQIYLLSLAILGASRIRAALPLLCGSERVAGGRAVPVGYMAQMSGPRQLSPTFVLCEERALVSLLELDSQLPMVRRRWRHGTTARTACSA